MITRKIANMKSFSYSMLATGIAVIMCMTAYVQQPVYSDITISAMSLTAAGALKEVSAVTSNIHLVNHTPVAGITSNDVMKCSITINNISGANAYGAKLIVVLPAEASVSSGTLPSNVTVISQRVATGGGAGYVEFNLLIIYPDRPVTVVFTFNKPDHTNKLSAFVICAVPDMNPANNYKDVAY